jgi:hypothetical protein
VHDKNFSRSELQYWGTGEGSPDHEVMWTSGLHWSHWENTQRERERAFFYNVLIACGALAPQKGELRGCSWWPPGKEETVGASDNARQIKDWECRRKEGAFMFVAWCTARHRFCNSSGRLSIICRNWSSTSWSGAKSENSSKSSLLQP